jgi:hypothetical protein
LAHAGAAGPAGRAALDFDDASGGRVEGPCALATAVCEDSSMHFPWTLDLRYVEPIRDNARPASDHEG